MRLLGVFASFAAVIGLATPAQADPGSSDASLDTSFLTELDRAGITYGSKTEVVAAGKKVCELMDQGQPENAVINSVSQDNPGFTTSGATEFTTIAASAYCPQLLGNPPPPQNAPPPPSSWFTDLPPLPAAL